MPITRIFASVFGTLLLCAALSPSAKADAFDKKTVVTFDQEVEIPGWTLPPGTYVFKLIRSISDRNIVQVWDGDETQLYATLHTVSAVSLDTPNRAYFTLDDRDNDEGLPPLLQSWFYPGDNTGWTFLYPKNQRQPSDYHSQASASRQRDERDLSARAQ
jgi:hypothetical protein